MPTFNDLWGGKLEGLEFNPAMHACTLKASTLAASLRTKYVITCQGVIALRFHNAIQDTWEYAEITEAHVRFDATASRHILELILWEDSELVIDCSSVQLNEVADSA